MAEAHLRRIIRVDLKSKLFSYQIDEQALALARTMDGKLLLVTNVKDLNPEDIVSRYKSLADIERGFRVLKSEIEIAPVHHRLPQRIRAHAMICFIALILQRVMRARLKQNPIKEVQSPERALSILRRVQTHRVTPAASKIPITGVSHLDDEQLAILNVFQATKPTITHQYANL